MDQPLGPDVLRCLRYMHDVEHHTMCYLRDVLVTRAHSNPEITDFLACWAYEELWHGEALGAVLAAHDEPSGSERVAPMRHGLGRRDRLRPLLFTVASAMTRHLVAVQMSWGAVNEWTTQPGYARLRARADHPELSELLGRIMKQEGRHIDFYVHQARARLSTSAAARRLTRRALGTWWTPVGAGVMPAEEVSFVSSFLFSGQEGRAAAERVDRQIDRLPGLEDLRLLRGSVAAE